jgi:hypothetical protein
MRHRSIANLTPLSSRRLTEYAMRFSAALSAYAIAFLLATAACSGNQAQCPSQSKLVNGACRPICNRDADCFANESCDPNQKVCINATDMDSGSVDVGDIDSGDDAGKADAQHHDAQPRDGHNLDAEPLDGGNPCASLDEQTCRNTMACEPDYCVNCLNTSVFITCIPAGSMPPACPALHCAMCPLNTAENSCRATGICHPVFLDHPGCAPCASQGCCMAFDHCAESVKAVCTMPANLCTTAAPTCEGNYMLSYTTTCYEGCVTPDECP